MNESLNQYSGGYVRLSHEKNMSSSIEISKVILTLPAWVGGKVRCL